VTLWTSGISGTPTQRRHLEVPQRKRKRIKS
jgi:hypothetical protein